MWPLSLEIAVVPVVMSEVVSLDEPQAATSNPHITTVRNRIESFALISGPDRPRHNPRRAGLIRSPCRARNGPCPGTGRRDHLWQQDPRNWRPAAASPSWHLLHPAQKPEAARPRRLTWPSNFRGLGFRDGLRSEIRAKAGPR